MLPNYLVLFSDHHISINVSWTIALLQKYRKKINVLRVELDGLRKRHQIRRARTIERQNTLRSSRDLVDGKSALQQQEQDLRHLDEEEVEKVCSAVHDMKYVTHKFTESIKIQ